MKMLLFGSTGALGTAIEEICAKKSISCIGLTHKDLEITNYEETEKVIDSVKPDVIINAVALIGINLCEQNPQKAFEINTIVVSHLAKICQKKNIIFVQPSTHAVFDGKKGDYYTEEDIPNPQNIYAISKYGAECLTRNICNKYYIVRFPTLFGSRRNKSPGFVDKMILKIKNREELKISEDKIDSPSYTRDIAKTIISLLEEKKSFGVYHVANNGGVSYYTFISTLIKMLNIKTKVIPVKDEVFSSLGKVSLKTPIKSVKLLPLRNWEDALKDYIKKELNENLT